MIYTYTGRRTHYGELTNDPSTANLAIGDKLMNSFEGQIVSMRAWPFLETTKLISSVAQQQSYDIPVSLAKVLSLKVTINGNTYVPRQSPTRQHWDRLNSGVSISSDYPQWYFVFDGQFHLWPIPASSNSNVISLFGRRKFRQLSVVDTVVTVATATNGSKTIVTSGALTAGMAGFYLQIAQGSGANLGDERWYEIDSVTNSTTLVLKKAYDGVSISAGSAAGVIGQVGLLPEEFQEIPIYLAAHKYYTDIQPEPIQARTNKELATDLIKQLKDAYNRWTEDPVIEPEEEISFQNPNDFPQDLS